MSRSCLKPFVLIICLFSISCASPGGLFKSYLHKKGNLTPVQLDSLRTYLSRIDSSPKDTIIIKYDFSGETCWDRLDMESDDYIDRVVKSAQTQRMTVMNERPGVSVYNFRENGSDFNKLKLRDSDIKIDSSGFVRRLLFQENQACGTSGIILPSGDFILVKFDSHFDALSLSGKKIAAALK